MSFNGKTLNWHDRGQLSGAKLLRGILSAGKRDEPNIWHMVDDFQSQGKKCVHSCDKVKTIMQS